MYAPSFKRDPVAPVWSAFSEPAKSTKFKTLTCNNPSDDSVCGSRDSIVFNKSKEKSILKFEQQKITLLCEMLTSKSLHSD